MSKDYTSHFQKKILKTHIIIALISIVLVLLASFYFDYFYNGVVIDLIQKIFGWRIANFILKNQTACLFIGLLLILLLNSLIVEIYSIKIISRVFDQMKVLFQKDDQRIFLDDSLNELERDLNDLKKESLENEKKVIENVQYKVDMITYLAHDIKTPLASIVGYLCLLNETKEMDEDLRHQYTYMTLQKAYRLEKLINEFFEIAKLNQSNQNIIKEEIPLLYMLEQMKEEFYPLLKERQQKIHIDVSSKIMIYGDSQKIARVFSNILKNALYYGDAATTITIDALEDETCTHIFFQNTGPTIPQDKLDCIFEQFYRLDESRSSYTGGSGLGLSIAKLIIEQHLGEIHVTSQHHQTSFEVILPKKAL